MEPGTRIASPSGVVVKNRSSSGCLIVRKKGDGLGGGVGGGSSSRKQYESKKLRKKAKVDSSDSESSGELVMPPARRLGPETIRVCNSLIALERGGGVGGGEISRKRERMEQIRRNGDGAVEGNGLERREKKIKLDVFDFDEYDGAGAERMRRRQFDNDGVGLGGGRFMGTMHAGRGGIDREIETGSSRHIVDKRKKAYYDRASGLHLGDSGDNSSRIKMKRDGPQRPLPSLKEKFKPDESIRVQGKNGVLKVMVNKKKVGGSVEPYDHRKPVESRQSLRAEGTYKRNVPIHSSSHLETKSAEKQGLLVRPEKKQITTRKSLSSKEDIKGKEQDSDDNDTSMNLEVKNIKAHTPSKKITSENEQTPVHDKLPTTKSSEGKIRRGSGTEKQKLREQIREMLLNKGWTIDYRPRRNRDYLDAVYINPAGTAYWSIIKAYDALQKQLIEDEQAAKGESSSFAPIADDVLSQLTRKTRKKMEKDLKMKKKKQRIDDIDSGKERQIKRTSGKKHHMNGIDSDSNEDKLSSFIKQQGSKSMKAKLTENAVTGGSSKSENATIEKPFSESDPQNLHGRKSRKHGRCTLLVRSSNKGLNSESDDFVPYTGKRTVLSWLVDSGVVQVSQKVQYRRRKKVMLEGWITREGIHCGCCSKILTVSKFELHAGSKLPQPYQNIYLDSGFSLLQCQIDAWEKQENFGKISFHSVDIDGNDPNDDTCGICGDGGDLICCDGCPSTFHQSCLGIQMLPPGDWHCPNCTCKFCGLASATTDKEDDATVNALRTCDLCEKKYHDRCTKDTGALLANSNMPEHSFCGKSCKELFENLKKYLGTKHELDAGFTWCLVRRTDDDSEAASRGVTHRVECNSKLAVALTVMDECFLPVVDRRSGINIIHNSLYNSGSNFSRLNYTGFYTAILERGDEIISAASIRFHGTKLAEMPFIGTRHIYRHQGMCRRLFSAIELALCSLKVEKLVIPAISELVHTWTTVFGFTHLEESLRQEMRSLNMLVFPGIDMLQKLLAEQGKLEDAEQFENGDVGSIKPAVVNGLDIDSSALQHPHVSADARSNPAKKINNEISDASQDISNQGLAGRTVFSKSHSEERLSDSVSENCASPSNSSHGVLEKKNKIPMSSPINDPSPKCRLISPNDISTNGPPSDLSDCHEIPSLAQATACSDLGTVKNLVEPASEGKPHAFTDMKSDSPGLDRNPVSDSQVADNALSFKEFDMNDAHVEVLEAGPLVNSSQANNTEENNENVDVFGSVLNHAITDMNCDSPGLDQTRVSDSQVADNALSSKEFDMNDAQVEVLEASPLVNSSQANNTKENNENADDSGSVLNHAITDMNCDSPGLDQNPVSDSRVSSTALSSKEFDMNDAHVEVLEAGPLVNSSQANNTEENNENADVSGSVLNHAITDMSCDSPGLGQNPVSDTALSSKEFDMNDAQVEVLEASPLVNSSQANNTDENNENADVSGSVLNHAITDMNCDSPGLDQNPLSGSRVAGNALVCKEFDMNDAHVEVLEAGPLVNSSQANNTKENNENADISGSVLNHAFTDMRSDSPGLERNSLLDSQVADNALPFKEFDMNDAHVEVLEAGPLVNSSQGNNTKENNENVDVSGSALDHASSDMNSNSPGLDQNPLVASQVADNALPFKEFDVNDARVEVLEAGPSVNSSEGNNAKENDENVDVSGSVLHHAGERSLQVRSDLNGEIAYEGEKNSHLDTEVASNELHLDETGLYASGDGTETDQALNG